MAITANTMTTPKAGWVINATSADLSACEELKAAVAGVSHYIRGITINSASAITVTVGEGETTNNVTTALIGPVTFTTAGYVYHFIFLEPIKLTAATALTVDASGAGTVHVMVQGFTK